MRALTVPSILLPLVLACGAVRDRPACAASTDCPAGQYCAPTADGSVCWPDAVPPSVSGVTASCLGRAAGEPCLRDGTLRVEATVADDAEVLGAEVTLDVGGPAVPMQRAGGVWRADVELRRMPFDHFAHPVVATVAARDGARNHAFDAAAATTVTRLVWRTTLGAALAVPAVTPTGILVVPANSGRVHFVGWDGTYLGSTELAASTPQTLSAPTVIGSSVWVGAEDGNVYELANPGSGWVATQRANTGAAVRGSLGVTSTGTVIAASESGVVWAITSTTSRNGSVGLPFSLGPVVDSGDGIFAVAAGSARRFTLVLGIPTDAWSSAASFGGTVGDPLACTTSLVAVANTGTEGIAKRVTATGTPETLGSTALPSSGIVLLSDGSIIVPEQTKTLARLTTNGAVFPSWQKPDLGGATRTPLVLTASVPFVVPTAKGALHGLRPDGSIAWSGQLSAGTASLQPGNIYTPPGQPAGEEQSVAYFAGSDGVLHAVIVDGRLDAAAPWPKAFHDARNTNRAGAPQ